MALDTLLSPDSARYRINPFIGIGIKKKKKKKQCRSVIATLSLTRSLNNFNRNKTLFMLAR